VIDAGAANALARGKSLLPAGVVQIEGDFTRGDAVRILSATGNLLGRGLVNFDAEETLKIVGKKSDQIAEILGYTGRSVLIHRDNMVLAAHT